jgi:signal peptidase I
MSFVTDLIENLAKFFNEWIKEPILRRRARLAAKSREVDKSPTREIIEIVVSALGIALVFKWFFFQPFNIPSGSMKPTLLIGDYIFVSKFSYGYSHKSFFFSAPLFDGRIFASEPERGDVIVFKKTSDGKTDFIKRLVGLPGDRVQMVDGVLQINDEPVKKTPIDEFLDNDPRNSFTSTIERFEEELPGGVVHSTLDDYPNMRLDNTGLFVIPQGHYFMMGDNRDHSSDSRDPVGGVNYVPAENLVGRAEIIFFSVDGTAKIWQVWKWPMAIRYDRVFKRL